MTEKTEDGVKYMVARKKEDDDEDYWLALGKFIEAFARADEEIFFYLCGYINIPYPEARAIFAGFRTTEILKSIENLWAVRPPSPIAKMELKLVFKQFKDINEIRNRVVHNPSFFMGGKDRMSSTARKSNEFRVSSEPLDNMTHDLDIIFNRVLHYVTEQVFDVQFRPFPWQLEPEKLLSSWRYISPSLLKMENETKNKYANIRRQVKKRVRSSPLSA